MTTIHKSALLPYSAAEMYVLVADIEAYPQFLPWCGGARVLKREGDSVTAAIDIDYGGIHKTFTTRNDGRPVELMEMRLVEGPFRHLLGHWRFTPLDERACKVSFDLEFEFSSRMLGLVVGPVFQHIANGMVDSFRVRAVQLYGRR
ncbi:MAG: type II toxin-antitoxin system RatA family toxin [Gammaproteobacteria bacterium]|nr:type II toxin-antitoxin system RatA family toxin [Gammaproteobacteria bacterium]